MGEFSDDDDDDQLAGFDLEAAVVLAASARKRPAGGDIPPSSSSSPPPPQSPPSALGRRFDDATAAAIPTTTTTATTTTTTTTNPWGGERENARSLRSLARNDGGGGGGGGGGDDDDAMRRRRRRRRTRPRHEIAAWLTTTTTSTTPSAMTTSSIATSSLSEGENWIALLPPPDYDDGGDGSERPPPVLRVFASRDDDGAASAVLCIDVDDVGRVATAKDARPPRPPPSSSSSPSTHSRRGWDDSDHPPRDDGDAAIVDGCDLFLARRRRRRRAGGGTGGVRGDDDRGGSDDADYRVACGKTDGREDGADRHRPPPPGNPPCDRPEPLPRRQMRALRDGDRILVRCRCRSPPAGRPRSPPIADVVREGGAAAARWLILKYLTDDARADGGDGCASASVIAVGTVDDNDDGTSAGMSLRDADADGGGTRLAGESRGAGECATMDLDGVAPGGGEREMEGGRTDNNLDKGGVSIQDRGCMTATADDVSTMTSANSRDVADDGGYGDDAPTVGAVVLSAPASSQGPTDDGERSDDDSADELHTPPEARHDGEGVSIRPNEEEEHDADFAAESAILDTTEGTDNLLTARTSENDSEEELLSQPDHGDSLFLSQAGKSDGSDSDGSATDISKTQPFPLPRSALTNASRQSLSSYEDENDDDSTDCPDQNCEALSPLPEAAENGDSVEDDPDSRPDDEHTQNFPPMKTLVEDSAKYHENQSIFANANGKGNASPASSFDPTESRVTTSENDGADESVSDDPPDNEATQHFPLPKPLKIDEIHKNDEDDEAYEAETQIDDDENDVYQAETQTLSFLPINSLAKSSYPEEAGGMHEAVTDAQETSKEVGENNEPAITQADTENNQSELPEKSEAPIDEMHGRTVVRFEQPPSDSGGILEKDENKQAGGNVKRSTELPAEEFSEQAPVQLLAATDNDSSIEKQHVEMSLVDRVRSCGECDGGSVDGKNDLDLTPSRDRFTRRRGIPPSGGRKESSVDVKIMFTGLAPTRKHKQMIHDIGAQHVESIEEASTATRE